MPEEYKVLVSQKANQMLVEHAAFLAGWLIKETF
jgi:hypothetical protein